MKNESGLSKRREFDGVKRDPPNSQSIAIVIRRSVISSVGSDDDGRFGYLYVMYLE